jgi:Tfp pilus assembly protein PilZ
MRRSPRFTFETPVSFAPLAGGHPAACSDGSDGDHGLLQWGYSYNISRGGLFVRTVTPPGMGQELALEFSPPFGRGRVIVEGKVAWRQEFSRSRGFPPGFGLQYAEDLPIPDAAALEAGYAKLLADNGNPAP